MPTLDELLAQRQRLLELQQNQPQQAPVNVPSSGLGRAAYGLSQIFQGRNPTEQLGNLQRRQQQQIQGANEQDLGNVDQQIKTQQAIQNDALSKYDSPESRNVQKRYKDILKAAVPHIDTSFIDIVPGDSLGQFTAKDVVNFAIDQQRNRVLAEQKAGSQEDKQKELAAKKVDEHIKILRGVMRGAGPQTALGRSINRVTNSNDLLSTIDQINAGEIKDTRQAASELITGLNNLLTSSNQTSIEGFRNLFPKDFKGDIQAGVQYITGHPQEYLRPEMLKQIEHLVERQNQFWGAEYNSQVNAARNQLEPEFKKYPEYKDLFNNTLNEFVRARNRGQYKEQAGEQTPVSNLMSKLKF